MGRKRRNAYWTLAGGQVTVEEVTPQEQEEAPAASSRVVEEPPAMNICTRRSLRQQARKAAETIQTIQAEELIDGSEDSEDFSRFTALQSRKKRFLKEQRTHGRPVERKREEPSESTATALHRMIGKQRLSKSGYVVKPGKKFGIPRGRPPMGGIRAGNAQVHHKHTSRNVPPPPPLRIPQPHSLPLPPMPPLTSMPLPLKVEIQEGSPGSMVQINNDFPRKRGRKRKMDVPMNLSMKKDKDPIRVKRESLSHHQHQQHHRQQKAQQQAQRDPDWDPNAESQQQQQQEPKKRGRQSTATAVVKNRFPFCSLCLSKNPPSDYIINYMSCPSEYQRMKRLFAYIYKDLKFPFMPFDMERDNVFDYCDLPLCDCCIQLYREIYDSYAQIETARDQLKSKIERMVYQIQLSEQNPAVSGQLTSIKNSPDALMNKYCNFRRRFASYKPGEARGETEATHLVPATIARITVINQTPKRTSGTQTFLTAGHFPPPPPATPQATSANSENPGASSSTTTTSNSATVTASSSSNNTGSTSVTIKKEPQEPEAELPEKVSSSKPPTVNVKNTSAASPSPANMSKPKEQSAQRPKPASNSTPAVAKSNAPSVKPPIVPATPATPKPNASSDKPSVAPTTPATPKPSSNPVKPLSQPSVLTIIKTPGSDGPAIIRKMPAKPSIITQHSRLLAIATPTHKTQSNVAKTSQNGPMIFKNPLAKSASSTTKPASPENESVAPAKVKDEPKCKDASPEEEADPFFSNGSNNNEISGDSTTNPIDLSDNTITKPIDLSDKGPGKQDNPTPSDAGVDNCITSEEDDTNVFHKHKKLKILQTPSNKDSSNDSSDNNMTNNEDENAASDENDDNNDKNSSETGEADGGDTKNSSEDSSESLKN